MKQLKKYYVSMTDTFLSGWGYSKDRINKLIFKCDTLEEALIVEENAKNRTDQKYVNLCSRKPYYNNDRYYVQIKTKEVYPCWYKKGFFHQ